MFSTVFKIARHFVLIIKQTNLVHAPLTTDLKSVLILSYILGPGTQSGIFHSYFTTKICMHIPVPRTCHKHRILLFLISWRRRRNGDDYVPRNSSLTSFIQSYDIASLLSPNILLNTISLNTVKIRSSVSVKDQVSNQYKTSKKKTVMYI